MVYRHYRLPSLTSLAAFEASARHRSIKRAAEELTVTPEANDLWLEFSLPAGSYATVLLDQLLEWE